MRSLLVALWLICLSGGLVSAQEYTGTLQKIKQSGVMKIGYRQSQPPMSSVAEDGTPVGYSIDLCKQIVEGVQAELGGQIKVDYVPLTAENRFKAVAGGTVDLLCGATTKTLARGEIVDFTQLTFVTGASFMTLKGQKLRNNFKGKKIGVVKDTTTVVALKDLFAGTETGAEVVLFDSTEDALTQLNLGKIDAFSSDQVVLIGLALAPEHRGKYTILPDLFSYEPFALAVRRNDADFRLLADRVLAGLCRSEKILKIYDKWFSPFSVRRNSAFEVLVELNATPEQ